jgi:trimethylamine:corrinoid methyltransferase-like protein
MEAWWGGDQLDSAARSQQRWEELLASYTQPDLDHTIQKQLGEYLEKVLD